MNQIKCDHDLVKYATLERQKKEFCEDCRNILKACGA